MASGTKSRRSPGPSIGLAYKVFRLAKKKTVAEISSQTGLSEAMINLFESGEEEVEFSQLGILCMPLTLDASELVAASKRLKPESARIVQLATKVTDHLDEAIEILQVYDCISKKEMQVVGSGA